MGIYRKCYFPRIGWIILVILCLSLLFSSSISAFTQIYNNHESKEEESSDIFHHSGIMFISGYCYEREREYGDLKFYCNDGDMSVSGIELIEEFEGVYINFFSETNFTEIIIYDRFIGYLDRIPRIQDSYHIFGFIRGEVYFRLQ